MHLIGSIFMFPRSLASQCRVQAPLPACLAAYAVLTQLLNVNPSSFFKRGS
jgi:hypothetical protein